MIVNNKTKFQKIREVESDSTVWSEKNNNKHNNANVSTITPMIISNSELDNIDHIEQYGGYSIQEGADLKEERRALMRYKALKFYKFNNRSAWRAKGNTSVEHCGILYRPDKGNIRESPSISNSFKLDCSSSKIMPPSMNITKLGDESQSDYNYIGRNGSGMSTAFENSGAHNSRFTNISQNIKNNPFLVQSREIEKYKKTYKRKPCILKMPKIPLKKNRKVIPDIMEFATTEVSEELMGPMGYMHIIPKGVNINNMKNKGAKNKANAKLNFVNNRERDLITMINKSIITNDEIDTSVCHKYPALPQKTPKRVGKENLSSNCDFQSRILRDSLNNMSNLNDKGSGSQGSTNLKEQMDIIDIDNEMQKEEEEDYDMYKSPPEFKIMEIMNTKFHTEDNMNSNFLKQHKQDMIFILKSDYQVIANQSTFEKILKLAKYAIQLDLLHDKADILKGVLILYFKTAEEFYAAMTMDYEVFLDDMFTIIDYQLDKIEGNCF